MDKARQPSRWGMWLALGLLLALLLQVRPLDDLDLFWQLRLGQLMLEQGHLITHDPFTYTVAGQPVPPLSWLAQLIYAGLYHVGSWSAVQLVHILCFAAAFVLVGASVQREVKRPVSIVAAIFLGLLVSLPHSGVRPQGFGVLGFALLLVLATSNWSGRAKIIAAVPLLVLWQNLHPSMTMGTVLLAPLAGAGWVRWRRGEEAAPWTLTLLLGLTILAHLATPMGWGIFAVLEQNRVVARTWLGISEWMPPWDESVRAALMPFWAALMVSVVLLIRLRFRVRLDDLALFIVMTLLTLTSARFALFWAVALVPAWGRWIDAVMPAEWFKTEAKRVPAWLWPTVLGLEAVGVGLLYLLGPRFAHEIRSARSGAEALHAALPSGRIYNYREWGGPLILEGSPPWQVALDGRLYLFDLATWQQYDAAADGKVPLADLERQHQPDAFFLRPTYHEGLLRLLLESPDWQRIYQDESCSVFVRRTRP